MRGWGSSEVNSTTPPFPPAERGGGTVDGVGPDWVLFTGGIADREKNGTPGAKQIIRVALCYAMKNKFIGQHLLHASENEHLSKVFQEFAKDRNIDVLDKPAPYSKEGLTIGGRMPDKFHDKDLDPSKRVAIVSLNVRHTSSEEGRLNRPLKLGDKEHRVYYHCRYLAVLVDNLFGIQMRAGCSCAGPYAHHLFGIPSTVSNEFKLWLESSTSHPDDISFMGLKL